MPRVCDSRCRLLIEEVPIRPSRILILGNTGSGKTTLARALSEQWDLAHLDLDTIVFDPERVAHMRSEDEIATRLDEWLEHQERWVIEGSYGQWAAHLSGAADGFVFLNPGVERCLEHQRSRPWEPHKYDDPQEQERRRAFLEQWTRRYAEREDTFGLAAHLAVFERFDGARVEVGDVPDPRAVVTRHLERP